ncbi:ABC transporter G family member 20-like isoform X2 [Lytechinus pictus]|uniref:ABC transporter G family member 20-like isoform X2 n=1 Tax=Lytechinus pictus TaxID=7653 RepID=UPI0030B9E292
MDSFMMMYGQTEDVGKQAIECYDICKHYGRGKSKLQVLQNLAMRVPKGKIYGLLGPSGCGKTTLLRCVLGRLSFDSGLVLTLGRPPLTRGHGIPGSRVGYMPQEIALYNEFSIKETLVYFATIHKMSRKEAKIRIEFLVELLNLPEKGRIVGHLSGGQKRRVSFAVALIHSPELLILDEPTVGVDPLLRQKIWDYLMKFSTEQNTTVILTTHYIEEARNADMVGLMRNGKILSEDSPQSLLEMHNLPTLEGIFLKLCMADAQETGSNGDEAVDVVVDIEKPSQVEIALPKDITEETTLLLPNGTPNGAPNGVANGHCLSYTNPTFNHVTPAADPTDDFIGRSRADTKSGIPKYHYDQLPWEWSHFFPSFMSMWALFVKDIVKLGRNPGLTVFYFMVPIIEVSLFYLAIGGTPRNLPVAVVNHEIPPILSKEFLNQLPNETIIQKPVDTMDEALDNIREGAYYGIIEIPENYTTFLLKRFTSQGTIDNATLDGSNIKVTLDATNQQIAITLQTTILEAYNNFISLTLEDYGINPAQAQTPVVFVEPIYGSLDASFTEFMVAGVVISIIFFLAVGLTSVTFVVERKEGLMDRSWVAGVSTGEVTIAHVSTQFLVISVQIAVVLIFTFIVFNMTNEGNIFLIVLMCMLQGLCGMSFGLLISSVCDTEAGAVQAALGSFYPILLLSGIIWPIQAIPYPLYYISLALPQTYAAESLRAIMSKGWGVDHFEVWIGYVITTAWWVIPLALSALILHIRR